ncbi:hypothetical protein KC19_2G054700 [Ceratodon purpureus]|uniref:Uncharacterized protein n=1 Tax=Ceratodon purpureus TaxID=3225 RepID=A0A8T0ITJ8_CERPU|nr:hypothetical protein KC19_2G054700 [Ceratodon purpureus]
MSQVQPFLDQLPRPKLRSKWRSAVYSHCVQALFELIDNQCYLSRMAMALLQWPQHGGPPHSADSRVAISQSLELNQSKLTSNILNQHVLCPST